MARDVSPPPGTAVARARARRRERGKGGGQKSTRMFRGGSPWARNLAIALLLCGASVAQAAGIPAAEGCEYVDPDNGSDGAQNVDGSCKSVVTGGNNDKQLALGETCTPECDEGFELSGVMTSSCSAEGIFTPATCLPVDNTKCTMQLPDSASAGTCTGEELASGSSCVPACNAGYSLSGQLTTSCAAGTLTLATCVALCTCCESRMMKLGLNLGRVCLPP